MTFKTDLNQRERRRYAGSLRQLAGAAENLATNLEAEDDAMAVVNLVLVATAGHCVTEILEVMKGETEARTAAQQWGDL